MTNPIRLVIFGRQGAGKGTQCAHLVEHYGIAHISTGDMLRGAVAAGTELGLVAKAVMDTGNLVSDEVINGIVEERLDQPDAVEVGYVLDGYPRTIAQAEFLVEQLGDHGVSVAIDLHVPLEEVSARMRARGRGDDTEEGIARRLELYEQETLPVLKWFDEHGLLVRVDGFADEEVVTQRLFDAIEGRVQRPLRPRL